MNTSGYLKKYSLEFLVVFLGILSSFGIDNYLKNTQRINEKNTLLDELNLSINEDLRQLEIVNGALDDCLNSINVLFEQAKEKTLNDSLLAYH